MTKEENQIKINIYQCFDIFLKTLENIIEKEEPIPDMIFYDKDFKLIKVLICDKDETDEEWCNRSMALEKDFGAVYTATLLMDDDDIDKELDYFCTIDDQDYISRFYHLNGTLPWDRNGWIEPNNNQMMN